MTTPTTSERVRRAALPPRWFIRGAWVAHRALYNLTGGRFGLVPPEKPTGNYVKVVQRVPVRIDFNDRNKSDFNQDGRLRPGLSVTPSVRVR